MTPDEIVEHCRQLITEPLGVVAERWKARQPGGRVVAAYPVWAPAELIHAAGMLPLGFFGGGTSVELTHADARFQSFVCSIAKSSLELGFQGLVTGVDGFVFSNICDVARNLSSIYQRNFPDVFVEYLHLPQNSTSPAVARYAAAELRRLARSFERHFGLNVAPTQIAKSIDVYNVLRARVRALYALRIALPHKLATSEQWAAEIADVPAETIHRLAKDYLTHARIGATTEIDGVTYPHRPVAVLLGKTVTNGWGGYECCWARTLLAALVGALEVPGGILGTTVRINRPAQNRHASVKPGVDGFMAQPLNPTEKGKWKGAPHIRNAYQTLVPLAGNSAWSAALGPAHLPWLFLDDPPKPWPAATLPDVWIIYRTDPAISNWDTGCIERELTRFPFIAAFAYTQDETNWYADLLLPEATDLESLQLYRIGGTKYIEQYWRHSGWALRQPVTAPPFDTRDLTDVATDLASRTGLLEPYLAALNRGSGTTVPLTGDGYDVALASGTRPSAAQIWDRVCRAATHTTSHGAIEHDLEWFKRHGALFVPYETKQDFLHAAMVAQGLRYELPYQERIKRIGEELGARLHERGSRGGTCSSTSTSPCRDGRTSRRSGASRRGSRAALPRRIPSGSSPAAACSTRGAPTCRCRSWPRSRAT